MNIQLLNQLREDQPHAGTWMTMGSTISTELAARVGFNWVLIDLEHGLGNEQVLLPQLQSLSSSPTAAIVRVGHVDASLIPKALDWGAQGIMLPQTDSVEKATSCLQLMQFPPLGKRGYSGSSRVYSYGLDKTKPSDQLQPLFLPQIESWKGVQCVDGIAALPGVDVLFIGPTDLKLDLEAAGNPSSLQGCIDEVIRSAKKYGKQTGIVLRNREELITYREKGIQFLSFGSDLSFVRDGMLQALQSFQ